LSSDRRILRDPARYVNDKSQRHAELKTPPSREGKREGIERERERERGREKQGKRKKR